MAEFIGCQPSEWSEYENGKRPGWENVVKICTKLKVSADWLMFGPAGERPNELRFPLAADAEKER